MLPLRLNDFCCHLIMVYREDDDFYFDKTIGGDCCVISSYNLYCYVSANILLLLLDRIFFERYGCVESSIEVEEEEEEE